MPANHESRKRNRTPGRGIRSKAFGMVPRQTRGQGPRT